MTFMQSIKVGIGISIGFLITKVIILIFLAALGSAVGVTSADLL